MIISNDPAAEFHTCKDNIQAEGLEESANEMDSNCDA
jgi:hypothetical protein